MALAPKTIQALKVIIDTAITGDSVYPATVAWAVNPNPGRQGGYNASVSAAIRHAKKLASSFQMALMASVA